MDFLSWWVYILPIFAGLFLFGRIKGRYGKIDLFSWWTYGENTAWATLGFLTLYIIPYFYNDTILYWREIPLRNAPDAVTVADWWYEKTVPWESPVGFFLILCLILFGAMMKKDPKNLTHHKLAPYGLSLALLLILLHFFGSAVGGSSEKVMSWWNSKNVPPTTTSSAPSNNMRRAETQDYVISFWYKNLPVGDAREMLNIAQCESGFNHWDDNGNVVTNKNEDGSTDWGVMQVNDKAWGEKAIQLGHNLQSLEGNLAMALYIRKEQGADAWTCQQKVVEVKDEVILIPAPAFPEWSPVQKVKANCIWENTSPVLIKDDGGKVHRKNPGEIVNIITWTFQISTPEGEALGEMRYSCR